MSADACTRMRVGKQAVRAWPMWELPRWLTVFIIAVATGYVAAVGLALARVSQPTVHELMVSGALLVCIAATVEFTRRAGEGAGFNKDVFGVWDLPLAILLPAAYVLIIVALQYVLIQCRIRRVPLHRRVFTGSAVALSYGAASLAFHSLGWLSRPPGALTTHVPVWILAVAAAAILRWAVNQLLVLSAVKGADPTVRVRDMVFDREQLQNDVVELCVTVVVTLGIAISLVTILFALPFVTLLQRSVRHAQLVNASRIDSKTGLLNAGTWEREAASEVARAVRTRTPLALVLIDIDHFKLVNDLHGHLAGDKALRAIAHTFQIHLRDYDLAGRFGGEEFALLLPQTSAADARQIAERVRKHIETMPISVDDDPVTEPVQVTVSVGVAALGVSWERTTGSQFTDLLAGADGALYRAKHAGRNQVWMVTDTATMGAAADAGQSGSASINYR
jgi:diguanylate cyclase (GGDEF)-like protein